MAKIKPGKVRSTSMIGGGVADNTSGITPKESAPMGMYWGTGVKNPVGKLRSSTVGYRPVSRKQLGTPPTKVV